MSWQLAKVTPQEALGRYTSLVEDNEQAVAVLIVEEPGGRQGTVAIPEVTEQGGGIQGELVHLFAMMWAGGVFPGAVLLSSEIWLRVYEEGAVVGEGDEIAIHEGVGLVYADRDGRSWAASKLFTRTRDGVVWRGELDIASEPDQFQGSLLKLLRHAVATTELPPEVLDELEGMA